MFSILIVLCSFYENEGRIFANYNTTFSKHHEKAENSNLKNGCAEILRKKTDKKDSSVLQLKTMRLNILFSNKIFVFEQIFCSDSNLNIIFISEHNVYFRSEGD